MTLALTVPTPARADTVDECIASADRAQAARSHARLLVAQKELLDCARPACPTVVKKDCSRWLREVLDATPTIVLSARDGQGRDLTDVSVTIDGAPLLGGLDGRAIPVDPGAHAFRFAARGKGSVEREVIVREAERERALDVVLRDAPNDEAPPAQPRPEPGKVGLPAPAAVSPTPATFYVFGGVGGVALASFAFFGIAGIVERADLQSTCFPHCSSSATNRVRMELLVADISLGVAAAGIGGALWIFLTSRRSAAPASSWRPRSRGLALDVAPLPHGGVLAHVGGAF